MNQRLDRIEAFLERMAEQREIDRQEILAQRQVSQREMAELCSTVTSLVQVVAIHQPNFERFIDQMNQIRTENQQIWQEIRGLRTESQRILEHLFGRQGNGQE
ncbi:MAG: hypothetical protein HC835_16755 [Oscillatoriales cyanobacterium RM2_1_1]|nr:hypothetical protein [Oscillatoriales cyanobacterium SM2_3_0]NJO47130.1 hypothetical protein [Oscillatoriales cyanobacterium RM2_1_1]